MSVSLGKSKWSWEPEMFISGGVLLTLYQAPHWLAKLKVAFEPLGNVTGLSELVLILAFATSILTIGFTLHLIIKSLWVGMKAFSYVHGNKILADGKIQSSYKSIYKDDLLFHIDKTNRFAGLIFGTSIYLMFSIIGIVIYLSLISILDYLISFSGQTYLYFLLPLLIYLFDTITFGLLRKYQLTAIIYKPIYVILSLFSLSFIYRPLYNSMIANYSKLKIVVLIFGIIVLSLPQTLRNVSYALNLPILTPTWQFYENQYDPSSIRKIRNNNYIDNLKEEDDIALAAIQSEYIDKDVLKLYINYKKVDQLFNGIRSHEITEEEFQDIVSEKINILIDNKTAIGKFRFQKLNSTSQYMLVYIAEVYQIEKGNHVLTMSIPEMDEYWRITNIEFWKE